MAKSDQARLQEFLRFQETFLGCDACVAACRDGQVSSKHPEKYLQQVHNANLKKKHELARERRRQMLQAIPKELQTVVSLQKQDGRWQPAEVLNQTLAATKELEPPDGITPWRWTTYVATAFLRQFPEHYEFTAKAYEKAERWVQDQDLLALATDAIVPQSSFHVGELDQELVQTGKWSLAARQLVVKRGYAALLPPRVHESLERHATAKEEKKTLLPKTADKHLSPRLIDLGATKREVENSNLLFKANLLRDIGRSRIKLSSLVSGGNDKLLLRAYKPLEEAYPLYKIIADDLSCQNEAALKQIYQVTSRENEEETERTSEVHFASISRSAETLDDEDADLFTKTREELRQCLLSLGLPTERLIESIAQHEAILECELESIAIGRAVTRLKDVECGADYFIEWNCEWTPVTVLKVDPKRKTVDIRYTRIMAGSKPLVQRQVQFCKLRHVPTQRFGAALSKHWSKLSGQENEIRRVMTSIPESSKQPWRGNSMDYSPAKKRQEIATSVRKASLRLANPIISTHGDKTKQAASIDVLSSLKRQRTRKVVEGTFALVVEAIHRFERHLRRLEVETLCACTRYREAKMNSDQNSAFSATTRLICEHRAILCAVVEAVVKWRETLASLSQNAEELIWNGSNLLRGLAQSMDFLSGCKEVQDWYGPELQLTRNPFVLAVPLDQHPRTPRSALRKELVRGNEVLVVNPKLAAQRVVDEAALDKCWQTISHSPLNWPACSRALWDRIRAAESVLIAEEAFTKKTRKRLLDPLSVNAAGTNAGGSSAAISVKGGEG